ncbi:cryptochrome [Gonapodya prolifera JEL478]|uniref:Cryptochrome DASH n=1 Tax=Gonapodya prolifera (strain JEL478) TaxID=1344416 RepID=A0A139AFT6_GONPJ|nr:cryptochrome [Gonapodya prolifera JEL478]|eukprot:KXS15620.1 cryptochrome [Gonapodya prolifera JEL478]
MSTASSTASRPKIAIILLNGAPRLHDNPLWLLRSPRRLGIPTATHALPLFCLDPRRYDLEMMYTGKEGADGPKTRWFGFPKCGKWRSKFIIESVQDIRTSLKSLGSDLCLVPGRIETVVPQLVESCRSNHPTGADVVGVWISKEISSEELVVERKLAQNLSALFPSVPLFAEWTSTVFPSEFTFSHSNAWPASSAVNPVSNLFGGSTFLQLPDVFNQFRKLVESRAGEPPEPYQRPASVPPLPDWLTLEGIGPENKGIGKPGHDDVSKFGHIPSSLLEVPTHESSAFPFRGGESSALGRLNHYISSGLITTYKQTRNGLLGEAFSTKFSPWLADGSLSARKIWHQVRQHENTHLESEGSAWILFELLWREFFKFHAVKYGDGIFRIGGVHAGTYKETFAKAWKRSVKSGWDMFSVVNADSRWALPNNEAFKSWADGRTGIPWVDAGMRELKETGFLSNRSRQNVASFFLQSVPTISSSQSANGQVAPNWLPAAELFESLLIDHDPHSNYGNWQYLAGVGTDPRGWRKFNMMKQAAEYDARAEWVSTWVTELAGIKKSLEERGGTTEQFHKPWTVNGGRAVDEVGYPRPIAVEREWSHVRFPEVKLGERRSALVANSPSLRQDESSLEERPRDGFGRARSARSNQKRRVDAPWNGGR